MKSKQITILLSICVINILAQDGADILHRKNRKLGIKQITEITFLKHKNVNLYDKQGFLFQEISYSNNGNFNKKTYEYTDTDTFLIIDIKENRDTDDYENTKKRSTYKYFYNPEKQCYKIEYYSSDATFPSVRYDNFIYKDNLLQSYQRKNFPFTSEDLPDKVIYIYDNMKQVIKRLYITDFSKDTITLQFLKSTDKHKLPNTEFKDTLHYSYVYSQNGYITDWIIRNKNSSFTGLICWDNNMNKVHIKYANFDQYGNWKTSYFLTEKGKKIRSKREIKYW